MEFWPSLWHSFWRWLPAQSAIVFTQAPLQSTIIPWRGTCRKPLLRRWTNRTLQFCENRLWVFTVQSAVNMAEQFPLIPSLNQTGMLITAVSVKWNPCRNIRNCIRTFWNTEERTRPVLFTSVIRILTPDMASI